MTVRTIDEIFRDFVTDGVPASGPFNPHKPDIRDTLKALTEGSENFPDNRVIRLNNANEGTANNIVVTASVAIPAAAYQVLYILNVTQENTGPVTVSGAINRDLVTNVNQPIEPGYLQPGMALLCIDTGTELRLLSYGDAEAILAAAEAAANRAEEAAEAAESAVGGALSNFDTRSLVASTNILPLVNYVRTAGFASVGDGGGALYKRVASEPSHAGKVQSADGAWWEIVLDGGMARVGQFGSGQPAVEAAHTIADVIVIDVEVPITATATWPNGKSYMFTTGGKLSVANGVTLTVRGVVHADTWQGLPSSNPRKIFDCAGTGKVVGIRSVKPEWWGAKGDGVADDQPALQAAHDSVEGSVESDGACPEVVLAMARYGIGRRLSIRPTADINLHFIGCGAIFSTRFVELATFSDDLGPYLLSVDGSPDSIQKIASFRVGRFAIEGNSSGSAIVGLSVGGDGTTTNLIGVQQSEIFDVYVENFAFGYRLANFRQVDFNRCSSWQGMVSASVGALITVDSAAAFTGDLNFNSCQFVADAANGGKNVSITNGVASGGAGLGEIKGIRFNSCIFYKGSRFVEIYAYGGGAIGDIWINPGCQFDGYGNTAVHIECNGSASVIDSVFIQSVYIRGINSGFDAIRVVSVASGKIRDIHINGNQIFSINNGSRAIYVSNGVVGGTVGGNIITDIDNSTGDAILIDANRISVTDNVLNRSGSQQLAYFLTVGSQAEYCSVNGNIGGGIVSTNTIRNLGGSTNVIANNV